MSRQDFGIGCGQRQPSRPQNAPLKLPVVRLSGRFDNPMGQSEEFFWNPLKFVEEKR